ncbi:hypothetical protein [Legionella sp. CNM-4043-24]|uniref:hypothetical protein n=1 Tax=Legionella sp. CNM-4043-24 TaxID=3421646 RepID=UPI00403ACEDF
MTKLKGGDYSPATRTSKTSPDRSHKVPPLQDKKKAAFFKQQQPIKTTLTDSELHDLQLQVAVLLARLG